MAQPPRPGQSTNNRTASGATGYSQPPPAAPGYAPYYGTGGDSPTPHGYGVEAQPQWGAPPPGYGGGAVGYGGGQGAVPPGYYPPQNVVPDYNTRPAAVGGSSPDPRSNSGVPQHGGGEQVPRSVVRISAVEVQQLAEIFGVPESDVKDALRLTKGDRDSAMLQLEKVAEERRKKQSRPPPPGPVPLFDRVHDGPQRTAGGDAAAPGTGTGEVTLQYGSNDAIDRIKEICPTHSRRQIIVALNEAKGDVTSAIDKLFSQEPEGGNEVAAASYQSHPIGGRAASQGFDNGSLGGRGQPPAGQVDDLQTVLQKIEEQALDEGQRKRRDLKNRFLGLSDAKIDEALMLTDNVLEQAALYIQNVLGYRPGAAAAPEGRAAPSVAAPPRARPPPADPLQAELANRIASRNQSGPSGSFDAFLDDAFIPPAVTEHWSVRNPSRAGSSQAQAAASRTPSVASTGAAVVGAAYQSPAPSREPSADQAAAYVPTTHQASPAIPAGVPPPPLAKAPPPPPPPTVQQPQVTSAPVGLPAPPVGKAPPPPPPSGLPPPPTGLPPPPAGLPPPPAPKAPPPPPVGLPAPSAGLPPPPVGLPPPPAAKLPPPPSQGLPPPPAGLPPPPAGKAPPPPAGLPPPPLGKAPPGLPPPGGPSGAPPPPPPPFKIGGPAGGGPPPPPPPGMLGKFAVTANKVVQNQKTKSLFWQKIQTDTLDGTIWGKVGAESGSSADDIFSEEDRKRLEDIFAKKQADEGKENKEGGSGKENSGAIKVLDSNREKNIGIVLQFIRLPIDVMHKAISDFDELTISADTLSGLLSIVPTPEDLKAIAPYVRTAETEPQRLSTPVHFLIMTTKIEKFEMRLKAWSTKLEFWSSADVVASKINILHQACRSILESEQLPYILKTILDVGNYLNAGTSFQDAQAFRISDLEKIATLKTTDNKGTMLQFIVEMVDKRQPTYHQFTGELAPVHDAINLDPASIESDLKELRVRITSCATIVKQQQSNARVVEVLGTFLQTAQPKLDELEKKYKTADEMSKTHLANYFGEKPNTFKPRELFISLDKFCKEYESSRVKMIAALERANRPQKAVSSADLRGSVGVSDPSPPPPNRNSLNVSDQHRPSSQPAPAPAVPVPVAAAAPAKQAPPPPPPTAKPLPPPPPLPQQSAHSQAAALEEFENFL